MSVHEGVLVYWCVQYFAASNVHMCVAMQCMYVHMLSVEGDWSSQTWGCVALQWSDVMSSFANTVTGLSLNLPNLLKQKEEAVKGLTGGVAYLFKSNKVIVCVCVCVCVCMSM